MHSLYLTYIRQHLLNKGQSLVSIEQAEEEEVAGAEIFRESSRYRRRVGRIEWIIQRSTGNVASPEQRAADAKLRKIFHSPRIGKSESEAIRAGLDAMSLRFAFDEGWLMRRTDYEADGRTPRRISYIAGPDLYSRIQQERQQVQDREIEQLNSRMNGIDAALKGLANAAQPDSDASASMEARLKLSELLGRLYHELSDPVATVQESADAVLPAAWSAARQIAYTDLLIALAEIAAIRPRFDWKEIGARFYREIGGSKRFDPYKEDFLLTLERQLDRPLALLGLSSLGSLYSVYFTGSLTGEQRLFYPYGYVHAITDLAAFEMKVQSDCRCLWLVENRAVLTRMASERQFIHGTGSLVVGLDGQLRGAQKKLIGDLVRYSPNLSRILIWCDYDRAGKQIAGHVGELLKQTLDNAEGMPDIRWLVPSGEPDSVPRAYEWEDYLLRAEAVYTEEPSEQEIEMGGPEHWISWMND